eukprot:2617649-Heterocapsa_arctica.AAC.1
MEKASRGPQAPRTTRTSEVERRENPGRRQTIPRWVTKPQITLRGGEPGRGLGRPSRKRRRIRSRWNSTRKEREARNMKTFTERIRKTWISPINTNMTPPRAEGGIT